MSKARSRLRAPVECPHAAKWLGTTQIALALGCSPKWVANLIDRGTLVGMRMPNSKHRRVHPAVLEEFMQRHGYHRATGRPR